VLLELTNNITDLLIVCIVLLDTINLVAIIAKFYYDDNYKLIFFKVNNKVYFKLYKKYFVPAKESRKLGRQHIGLFKVIKRIERLIYKL